ncbi:MAG: ATP-dependent sacrificial sulfur transferase LarE [Janthinobacterium lividum]
MQQLRDVLHGELRRYDQLAVAYSGGVDSAYLAWEARQALGSRMIAVIADSPSLPRTHLAYAVGFAQQHDIPLRVVHTAEMELEEYRRNDGARCFHCKDELFRTMAGVLPELNMTTMAYGRNRDDSGDFRPGQRAAQQHHAVAPLNDARLGKAEIRALAQAAGLSVWDRPASACLSSRLEYGRPVTTEALRQVEDAEESLLALGFRQVRVRHHGEVARVEIERNELPKALSLDMLARITAAVKSAGFTYVSLDTEGYRSGSMNAILPLSALLPAPTVDHAA